MAEMTAADIAAVTNHGYGYGCIDGWGFGGGNGLWFLAILFLLSGGGIGMGGRAATVEDLHNSANFTRLENQVQGIGTTQLTQFNNVTNAVSTLGYETLKNFNALQAQLAECCCATQRAVDSVKFDMANYAAAINANFNDKFAALEKSQLMQTINSMAATIQDLQLDKRFCGVPKIQPATVYGAVPYNGYCGGYSCGYGNI